MSIEISTERPIAITTLGTCRVADTIAASAKSRSFEVENTNVYGFAHTPKEILQQIDFIEGVEDFPTELARYMSADGMFERGSRRRTDAFIVELSTLKEIIFDGWYLQINYLERALRSARGVFDAFSKLKSERDPAVRKAALEAVAGFAKLDSLDRRIVLEGYVRTATLDELEADMAAIIKRLPGPVIFVNHINLPGANGAIIESRAQLCRLIQEICRRNGYRHFDPTPHVAGYGQERALADLGRDLNHYTHDFKPVMGDLIIDTAFPGKFVSSVNVAIRSVTSAPNTKAVLEKSSVVEPAVSTNATDAIAVAKIAVTDEEAAVLPERLAVAVSSAKKLIAKGDLDDAEVVLHGLPVEDHHNAIVHTLLGTISFHRGDTAAAIAQFREAVALDGAMLEPRVMLVKGALRMGKLQEACSMAADLVRRAPDDTRILLVASKSMMRAKRYADSSGIWRRISYIQPELVMPHIEIARCELKLRNYEAAITAANDALSREPREPAALVIKSDALQKLKRMEELAEVSVELASIDPAAAMSAVPALISAHYPEEAAKIVACAARAGEVDIDAVMRAGLIQALERRGKVAEERGNSAGAAAAWKAILKVDEKNARAALGLRRLWSPIVTKAREAFAADDFDGATSLYSSALEIQEDNQRIIRELALVFEKIRDWVAASERWQQLSELTQRMDHGLRAARLACRAERYDLAVPIYHGIERDEEIERVFISVTRRLVRSMRNDFDAGQLDAAAEKANIVLRVDPESEPALRVIRKVMATYSRRLRDATAAQNRQLQEEVGHKMLVIEPLRKDALKNLAKLYRSTKRHRDGIEILERLTEVEPKETRHWLNLARSCRAIRLYERGVPAALRALEIEPGDLETVSLLSDMLNRQAVAA